MNRNHLVPRPTAPPTRGEEEKRAACAGQWHLIDVMHAHKPGTRYHEAARYELGLLCAKCPLLTCGERVA